MRSFQIGALLIISMLTEISFGVKKIGFPPHFIETQFHDFLENRYDGGSNEFQTSELDHLERRNLKRKVFTWQEAESKIEITPTNKDYIIDPKEITVLRCLGPVGRDGCPLISVYEKTKIVSPYGNSANGKVDLMTFSVPDGCDCRLPN